MITDYVSRTRRSRLAPMSIMYNRISCIVIFCDGTPHDKPEIQEDDKNKRAVLEEAGYVVLSWHYATPLEDFIARYPEIFTPVK